MSQKHKDEESDVKSDHPLGWDDGETLYVTGDEGSGEMDTELASVDEMLAVAGVDGEEVDGEQAEEDLESLNERIRARLPDVAFLTDDGHLGAENNRSKEGKNYLNEKRQRVLKKLDEGKSASQIYKNAEFTDSYVYRTRDVFSFLLEDEFLRKVFIKDDGEYSHLYEIDTEEATTAEEHQEEIRMEEAVSLEEAKEMAEGAYQKGLEEGKENASPEPESVDLVFDEDEWWDIMKTLLNNGEEELARRITSEIL